MTSPTHHVADAPVDTPLQRFVAVVEAEITRLRSDYDIRLTHSMVDSATQAQRCRRCGFWIKIGQPIALIERADRTRKDWIHQVCPDVLNGD